MWRHIDTGACTSPEKCRNGSARLVEFVPDGEQLMTLFYMLLSIAGGYMSVPKGQVDRFDWKKPIGGVEPHVIAGYNEETHLLKIFSVPQPVKKKKRIRGIITPNRRIIEP